MRRHRVVALLCTAAVFVLGALPPARAAEPYELNAILSLTGMFAFVGTSQLRALKALESYVNRSGGIAGRPLAIVASDDQSNPQVAVQIAHGLIDKHVAVIVGPTPGSCAAIRPLVAADGPVLYCFSSAGQPAAGGYVFLANASAEAQDSVVMRFLRDRGWHRLAYIVPTDASGQDAERALLATAGAPENKAIQIVDGEHFASADLAVVAQLARIKAAKPDALFAWATGTPMGTLLHGFIDAGIDVPIVASPGNLNASFFKQYGTLLPKDIYFASIPLYGGAAVSDRATKGALQALNAALTSAGAAPRTRCR